MRGRSTRDNSTAIVFFFRILCSTKNYMWRRFIPQYTRLLAFSSCEIDIFSNESWTVHCVQFTHQNYRICCITRGQFVVVYQRLDVRMVEIRFIIIQPLYEQNCWRESPTIGNDDICFQSCVCKFNLIKYEKTCMCCMVLK